MMEKETTNPFVRVIGLDAHPDSFTAAIIRGPSPAAAVVEKIFNKVPLSQLSAWAKKHTTGQDQFVLEASGNSFQVVRILAGVERRAKVLESCHLGKLKEAHANNDKISAVRIGKAYLAGTAKEVWVPDTKTQERRDLFHAYRKAVKRTTQMNARLRSYLSDNGVRLKQHSKLAQPGSVEESIRQARSWSLRQWQIIEGLLLELRHADQQRRHWRSLIAQEVLQDQSLMELVRLCGVRELVAFALGAFIGDIHRFTHPKQLVKYVGLNPAFDDSGQGTWSGGIGGHGNKHLRCLLIEGAQSILRCAKTPLAQWGKRLLARKSSVNLAVAAVARKLTVAVWYLMMGRWTPLQEIDERLCVKVSKVIGHVSQEALDQLAQTRDTLRQQAYALLKARQSTAPSAPQKPPIASTQDPTRQLPEVTLYFLDPTKKFTPRSKAYSLAAEYGLA
jgi:transposase